MHLGCNRYMTHYAFLYTFFMVYEKLVCMEASPPPPPSKTPLPSSLVKPPLNLQTVQAPSHLFRQAPLYNSFYENLSSLIPSHLLKVSKKVSKISQFKFFVKTEKNIFLFMNSFCH